MFGDRDGVDGDLSVDGDEWIIELGDDVGGGLNIFDWHNNIILPMFW